MREPTEQYATLAAYHLAVTIVLTKGDKESQNKNWHGPQCKVWTSPLCREVTA